MAARWLIKNATVVSMDPEIGILEGRDLLIEDGRVDRSGDRRTQRSILCLSG